MVTAGYAVMDADRAFARTSRARSRSVGAPASRPDAQADDLPIFDALDLRRTGAMPAIREIPVAAIAGTIEPGRACLFDRCFRPARAARSRWLSVWMAEQRGVVLPPISVVQVGDAYAVLDGHHRVSVALARGAVTIDAAIH